MKNQAKKINLMNKFENELTDALTNPKHKTTEFGDLSRDIADGIIDKWMEMETDEFDSDDLNEVIDRVEERLNTDQEKK